MIGKPGRPGGSSPREQREARLEEALRQNLLRRKAQARARSDTPAQGVSAAATDPPAATRPDDERSGT